MQENQIYFLRISLKNNNSPSLRYQTKSLRRQQKRQKKKLKNTPKYTVLCTKKENEIKNADCSCKSSINNKYFFY